MKITFSLATLFLALSLNANEFPLIQPLSVERAPAKVVTSVQAKEIAKQEKIKIETKNALNSNDSDEFAKTQLLDISFAIGSASISENSISKIMEFTNYLKQNKGYQVVLYGYVDSEKQKYANLVLSQKRVDNVISVLIENGVSSTRLTAVGKGEVDSAGNPRVEALIIK